MKKTSIYILIIVLALHTPLLMNGQALKSSYFLDNSTTRHTLNPALAPLQGYFGFPFLSSIGANIEGNVGISSLLFPLEDGSGNLGTFLHPDIASDQFLGKLKDFSFLDVNVNYDILSMGWNRRSSAYWTVDLGVRLNVNSSIPKELFSFLKNGMHDDPSVYSLKNFSLAQNAYAQVSLGYSQDISAVRGLRVGGKLKLLVGIDNAKVSIDDMKIEMSSNEWAISGNASAQIMGSGLDFVKDKDGKITSFDLDTERLGIGGYGVAFDLGAEYKFQPGTILEGLSVSASVTDLGFISYSSSNIRIAKTDNKEPVRYVGFKDLDVSNPDVSEELDAIQEKIFALADLKEGEVTKGENHKLTTNLHIGVKYSFLKDMMSVGLLYSGYYGPLIPQNELTISYNLTPFDCLGLVVSYSFLNTHKTIGWLINFTPRRGVNIFLGSDYTTLSYMPNMPIPMIPVDDGFLNVQLGISFPIGANNIRGKKLVQNRR